MELKLTITEHPRLPRSKGGGNGHSIHRLSDLTWEARWEGVPVRKFNTYQEAMAFGSFLPGVESEAQRVRRPPLVKLGPPKKRGRPPGSKNKDKTK